MGYGWGEKPLLSAEWGQWLTSSPNSPLTGRYVLQTSIPTSVWLEVNLFMTIFAFESSRRANRRVKNLKAAQIVSTLIQNAFTLLTKSEVSKHNRKLSNGCVNLVSCYVRSTKIEPFDIETPGTVSIREAREFYQNVSQTPSLGPLVLEI